MLTKDVVIIGAGAAGLMAGLTAARRGKKVLIIDHYHKAAEKIRISGGGRCNFTNLKTSARNFISENPSFCKSALSLYKPQDFLDEIEHHKIDWTEKTEGQLFCVHSAQDIIDLFLNELADLKAEIWLSTKVVSEKAINEGFELDTTKGFVFADKLIIASGGLSIPKIGASNYGYECAKRFGHSIIKPRPALVPLVFQDEALDEIKDLAGLSVVAKCTTGKPKISFEDGFLFTHRGLSGPSVLQISSYLEPLGESELKIDLLPDIALQPYLMAQRTDHPRQQVVTALSQLLPRRLAMKALEWTGIEPTLCMAEVSNKAMLALEERLKRWSFAPTATEGYRTAEVTAGGVNTRELKAKTLESALQEGLYFIGECVDVTGWLGGYNFQWAWSSGFAAGLDV